MSGARKGPRDRGCESPITRARLAAGMTQAQLAQEIGCLQKQVSRWEHGVAPRVQTLMKIAKVLGCSLDDLVPKDTE